MSEIKIKIENLYKIFGSRPREYTDIVRDGVDKDELLSKYNHVLGLDNISPVSYTHLTLPTILLV